MSVPDPQPTAAASGSRRKADVSKAALLEATADILSKGVGIDASLLNIARKAGVNSAMVKYYFGNKEGLLIALLERDAERAMDELGHLVRMRIPADRKLRIHVEGVINAYYRSPYLNRLLHYLMGSGKGPVRDRVTEIYIKPIISAYHSIIAQGVAEGTLVRQEPALLYHALIGACDHLFHAAHILPETMAINHVDEEVKRRYTQLVSSIFLKGMQP